MPLNLHRIHEDRILSNKDMLNGGHSISDYSRRFGSNSSVYDRIRDPYNRPYTRPFPTGRGLWRPEQHKIHSKTNGQDNSNQSKVCYRDLIRLVDFHRFSPWRQILWLSFCFSAHRRLWKRVYSKRKEFAPTGSKFFSFRIDPFIQGDKINLDRITSTESVSIPLK